MKNKREYVIEDEFLHNGVKAIFSKKNFFSSSFFLMMNKETSESFQRLESILNKEEGIVIKNLFVPNSEHTSNIVNLDENFEYKYSVYGRNRDVLLSMPKELCDAIYTKDVSKNLIIMPADCCCIGLYDYSTNLRAIIHAGYKGIRDKIIPKTIEILVKEGMDLRKAKTICFPSISFENYEVGKEIGEDFLKLISDMGLNRENCIKYNIEKESYNLNLKKIQIEQIKSSGILEDNIKIMNFDTFSDKDEYGNYSFHSYRRDRDEWRNIAILTGETMK